MTPAIHLTCNGSRVYPFLTRNYIVAILYAQLPANRCNRALGVHMYKQLPSDQ